MKTDTLFYRLFQTDPSLALELADLPVLGRYRFGSHEVKQTAFRLDGLLEPPIDQATAPLDFVEAQFQPDEEFYLRFSARSFFTCANIAPVRFGGPCMADCPFPCPRCASSPYRAEGSGAQDNVLPGGRHRLAGTIGDSFGI